MSLRKHLEDNRIDFIKDDNKFIEAEYNAVFTYCVNCMYNISKEDMKEIESRGLSGAYIERKNYYIRDLWEDFGEVPMNPDTEEIEESWLDFTAGTHREEIWHWFEEQFDISIAKDLMGQ